MISWFIISICILWSIRIFGNIIAYVHLWFIKEYRPDRMVIHITKTIQGRWIYFPAWKLPPLSPKTVVLTCCLIGSELVLFFICPFPMLIRLLVMDVSLFPISFFFVVLLRIPTIMHHNDEIRRAGKLIADHNWDCIIGITGSFGKTSTKEFLSTILGTKHEVLKTAASKNSAIGISEVVLSELKPTQSMLVVEMGAYRPREIEGMTALVRPSIGIVTAVNAQHQDLFGSIETTMHAKYELFAGLVGKRIAIVNADNAYTHTMGEWAKRDGCTVYFVTTDKKAHPEASYWTEDIDSDEQSISFFFCDGKKKQHITAAIRGEHFVMNLALAITAAIASGMSFTDATNGATRVHAFGNVMHVVTGKKGEILIDDTFNNNPDAAIASLHYLAKYRKRKVLVFQPMIELGSYTALSHRQVGEVAGTICDDIILTNANFSRDFEQGIKKSAAEKTIQILPSTAAAKYIAEIIQKGDAVLFKGKEAASVFHTLSGQ